MLLLVSALAVSLLSRVTAQTEKRVIGGVEEVVLSPPGIRMRARVDTGAAISQVDAEGIQVRGSGGAQTVTFTLLAAGGHRVPLELPLAGYRRIAKADGRSERRPVVRLEVCVAGVRTPVEVTLNDRTHLEYRALHGGLNAADPSTVISGR